MARWGAICFVVLAAALAAPAGAAVPDGIPTEEPVAGPVLSGSRALWVVPTRNYGFELRAARTGERPATLFAAAPRPDGILTPAIAASPERWILTHASGSRGSRFGTRFEARTVLTALDGAPAETLDEGCGLSGVPDTPREAADVDGNTVVFPRCDESGRHAAVVRDYSGPSVVEQAIPGARTAGLRIAGRYVAWLDGLHSGAERAADVVVYDRLAGLEAYRLTRAAIGGDVHSLDLQSDGKVAFSHSAPGGWKVAWASPAEPRVHALPLAPRERYDVRIANDRIAYMTGDQPGAGVLSLGEVGVSGLDGPARRIGNLAEGSVFTDDVDFDGERIAWWSYRCTDAVIRIAAVDGPAASMAPRSGCALRFERPPRLKSAWVRLSPDCFGFALEACEARDVVLKATRGGRAVTVGRGASAARVDLTPAGRALLRRGGRVGVRVSAVLTDDAGRRERRAGRATLQR
jgi:hypothetical protein